MCCSHAELWMKAAFNFRRCRHCQYMQSEKRSHVTSAIALFLMVPTYFFFASHPHVRRGVQTPLRSGLLSLLLSLKPLVSGPGVTGSRSTAQPCEVVASPPLLMAGGPTTAWLWSSTPPVFLTLWLKWRDSICGKGLPSDEVDGGERRQRKSTNKHLKISCLRLSGCVFAEQEHEQELVSESYLLKSFFLFFCPWLKSHPLAAWLADEAKVQTTCHRSSPQCRHIREWTPPCLRARPRKSISQKVGVFLFCFSDQLSSWKSQFQINKQRWKKYQFL